MSAICDKHNWIVAGRAAAAIYAVLKSLFSGREVLVPANVCYAAVYPILYSGNRPVFCDVADHAGNVSLETIKAAVNPNVGAVLVPHMYGNPVREIQAIAEFCANHGMVLIEDCASSMGAEVDGQLVGHFGDYAVFSTGHAKVVDLGGGGIVFSDKDLSRIGEILGELPYRDRASEEHETEFSRTYRRFLNTRRPLADFKERGYFAGDFSDCYLWNGDADFSRGVLDVAGARIDGERTRRKSRFGELKAMFLDAVHGVEIYDYADGAIPWRFSFFIDASLRQKVADALLAESIPVSDWYPVIVELFGDQTEYRNASSMGKSILNVPLTISDGDFQRMCSLIDVVLKRR